VGTTITISLSSYDGACRAAGATLCVTLSRDWRAAATLLQRGIDMTAIRLLFLIAMLHPAAAQAQSGMELAEENCSRCHAIGATGDSPLPEAPPFREIAQRYPAESLAESFAEGITTGHDEMPEFVFSTEDVGLLVEYFASLAKTE
jgi:mono/diheme cytochrome c family protein